MKIGLIGGSGHMGGALLNLWAPKHDIVVVAREKEAQKQIARRFGSRVQVGGFDAQFLEETQDLFVLCVSTRDLESASISLSSRVGGKARRVKTLCKGNYKGELADQIVERVFGREVLHLHMSGASFDGELGRGETTLNYLACRDLAVANEIAAELSVGNVSFASTDQVKELEMLGAMKQIGAMLNGMAAGLEYGENARALIFGEFFREVETFFRERGLRQDMLDRAGLEDLFLCCSRTSNHNGLGYHLGRRYSIAVDPRKRYKFVRAMRAALEKRRRGQLLPAALDLYRDIVVSPSQDLLGAMLNPPGAVMEVINHSRKTSLGPEGYEGYVTTYSLHYAIEGSDLSHKLVAVESLYDYFEGNSNPEKVIKRILEAARNVH